MSKMKLMGIAVGGLIIVNLALLGFLFFAKPSRPDDMPPGGRPAFAGEGPKQIIIDRLHFDTEQVVQYETLIRQHQDAVRETDMQIREAKNNLYATLSTGDTHAKDSLQNQLAQLQKQIETAHYSHFEGIKKICRPEQLTYFNELTKDLARFFTPQRNGPPPPPKD